MAQATLQLNTATNLPASSNQWLLDDTTKQIGRSGLAAARAALAQSASDVIVDLAANVVAPNTDAVQVQLPLAA